MYIKPNLPQKPTFESGTRVKSYLSLRIGLQGKFWFRQNADSQTQFIRNYYACTKALFDLEI